MSIQKEIGAALVVTYNRREKLQKCIKCLFEQTYAIDKIYVINNASTDDTEIYLKEISQRYKQIQYITTVENIGGAGGFEKGIKWAYDEGVDWIWGMDDDALPTNTALEILLQEREKKQGINAFWSNPDQDYSDYCGAVKKVTEWMFVGFFLPSEIISKVGLPKGEYFIYYDDYEYAERIIQHGYSIYKVKNSIIYHKDATSNIKEIRIGGKTINVMLLPQQDWKVYYLVRNDFLRIPRGDKRRKKVYTMALRRIVKTIRYNPRQITILIKGIWHGMIGKSGKVVSP